MGARVVPIVPDEARTFGMEGMFRQLGIYSSQGQKYTPHDSDQIMYYKEDKKGQILEEGINESGAMSAWIALATAYSNYDCPMVPFYIFYSMFGFQRIGDLAWAAGDSQARGFLIGATAGRTTLNGEGLQHQDGHSHLLASTIPNCRSYDPCYSYELAVIIQDGLKRMYEDKENCYYYITTMNENYVHPAMPEGAEEGIIQGIYALKKGGKTPKGKHRVQLMGAGTILNEVVAAADLLRDNYKIESDVWSVTSVNTLARDGQAATRWNLLHPGEKEQQAYITSTLAGHDGPFIIATDYMKSYGPLSLAITMCSAPMALAAAIPVPSCGISLKWIAAISPSLPFTGSPNRARLTLLWSSKPLPISALILKNPIRFLCKGLYQWRVKPSKYRISVAPTKSR